MARTNKTELKLQWAIKLAENTINGMETDLTKAISNGDWGAAYRLRSEIDGAKKILNYFKSQEIDLGIKFRTYETGILTEETQPTKEDKQ